MKRLWIVALVISALLSALPALAQDDDDMPTCDPDLSPVITMLEDASADFEDEGDVAAYAAALDEASTMLAEISGACGTALIVSGDALPLDETFEAADGSYSVAYPAGWEVEDQGFAIVLGSSEDAIRAFDESEPVFEGDIFGVGIIPASADILGSGAVTDVYELAEQLSAGIEGDPEVGEAINFSINDQPAVRYQLNTDTYRIWIAAVDYGEGNYAVFIGAGSPEAGDRNDATFLAIVQSFAYAE